MQDDIRIQNLIALRQLVVQVLVVLIGGTAGLILMPPSNLKIMMILSGIFVSAIFVKDFYKIQKEIKEILYRKRGN